MSFYILLVSNMNKLVGTETTMAQLTSITSNRAKRIILTNVPVVPILVYPMMAKV